jgi:hypothetical protein
VSSTVGRLILPLAACLLAGCTTPGTDSTGEGAAADNPTGMPAEAGPTPVPLKQIASGATAVDEFPRAIAATISTVCLGCHGAIVAGRRAVSGGFRVDVYYLGHGFTHSGAGPSGGPWTTVELWQTIVDRVSSGRMPKIVDSKQPTLSDDERARIVQWASDRLADSQAN